MSLPAPRPGLVVSYSYLWAVEQRRGREEGVKDRPCAIVAAQQIIAGRLVVTVVPVTHSPPDNPEYAIEIPAALKALLGMDGQRSWASLTRPTISSGRALISVLSPVFAAKVPVWHAATKILRPYSRQSTSTQSPAPFSPRPARRIAAMHHPALSLRS